MRLSKTQVIFFNIKGPELLHQDCGNVCVGVWVSVRCLGFSWGTWSLFCIFHTFTFIPVQHTSMVQMIMCVVVIFMMPYNYTQNNYRSGKFTTKYVYKNDFGHISTNSWLFLIIQGLEIRWICAWVRSNMWLDEGLVATSLDWSFSVFKYLWKHGNWQLNWSQIWATASGKRPDCGPVL